MNGFAVGRVKKSYFTKSQRNLPSTHPQEQFLEIIQIKKQYQTLIKQQLDALQKIENAEIKEISQWQIDIQRKQAKTQGLREKEAKKQIQAQEQKQEKLPQELRGCYDNLKKSQLSKCFTRVYDHLKDYRQYEIKRRASNYFYQSYIAKKYFKFWMDECGPAVKKLEQLKRKSKMVENQRKKCLFQFLCGASTFQQKQSSLSSYLSTRKKKSFFGQFCMITALKAMELKAKQLIRKSLKRKGLNRCYNYLTEIKKLQQLKQRQRLLQNIYCHRKLNSFFNAYREIKFKRQHSKITTSIINKIDLLQLVQTPEQQQRQQTAEKQEKEQELIVKKEMLIKRGRVNTDLLNLILQNFIEEYSQEYQCLLSEEEFSNFLHELKTQCVARLAANSVKRRVLKNLEMNKKSAVLTSITTIVNKKHALLALKLNNQGHKQYQQLVTKIKQRQFSCLFNTIKDEKSIKLKIGQINSSKMVKNLMKKQVIVHLCSCFNQRKKYLFKKDIAEKWMQSKMVKQAFLAWHTYYEHCQSSVASYKQKDNAIPNDQKLFEDYYDAHPKPQQQSKIPDQQKMLVKSKSQQKQIVPNNEQNQYCTTSRVSKAKQQLSRIVNIIGKGIGDRSSLYSSKKSSQSQSSNRPTVTRAKIESDQKDSKEQQILQIKNEEEKKHCQEKEKELQVYLWKSKAFQFIVQLIANVSQCKKIAIVKKMILRISLSNFLEIVENKKSFENKNSNFFQLISIKREKIVLQTLFSNKQLKQKRQKLSAVLTQNKKFLFLQSIKENREKQRIKKQDEKNSIDLKQRLNKQNKLNCQSFFESLKKSVIFEKKKKQLKSRHLFSIEMEFIQLIKQCFKEGKKQKSQQLEQLLDINQKQQSEFQEKEQQKKEYEEQQIKFDQQNKSREEEKDASFPQIKEFEKIENLIQDQIQHSDSQKSDNFVNYGHSSGKQQPLSTQRQNQLDISPHNQINNLDEQASQKVDSQLLNRLLIDDEDLTTLKKNISTSKDQNMPQTEQNYKKGLEYEQAQGEQWIFEKLKLNELKKQLKVKRIILFFTAFKSFSSKSKSSVESYFSQNNQTDKSKQEKLFMQQLSEIAIIRKRYAFQKLITEREKIEQQKIRKQQRKQIIHFGINKYEKGLKKKAFEGIYSLFNDKLRIKAKKACFTGWKLYSQQKRMLKEYLSLEAESVANSVSYYPQTMAEKKAFEQIKES